MAATYYVTPAGTDSSGTTCCAPMGIERAFSRSDYPAGSVVYVMRGEYQNGDGSGCQLSVGASDVSFVGVTDFHCDACTSTSVPSTPLLPPLGEGDTLTARHYAEYPVLRGDSVTDRASATAISIASRSRVTIRSLFIVNYRTGITVYGSGTDNRVERCIVKDLGYPFYGTNTGYSGKAILLASAGSVAEQCYVENAGAEGIGINGSSMAIVNCLAVGRDSEPGLNQASYDNGTDYYFRMDHGSTTPCTNNRIEHCIAERIFEGGHSGKAFTISGYTGANEYATDNDIRWCTAVNTGSSLTMRHPACYGNRITGCTVKRGVAICLVDSAHDNFFNRIDQRDGTHAILVNVPAGGSLHGTVVANSVFECWRVLTNYTAYSGPNGFVNTRLVNCTFKALTATTSYFRSLNGFGIDSLHAVNCIFDGYAGLTTGTPGAFTNSAISNCLLHNAAGSGLSSDSFAVYAATESCIDGTDPGFADSGTDTFRLTHGSACIDSGADLAAMYPSAPWVAQVLDSGDVYGETRIQNGRIDIGAAEYAWPVANSTGRCPPEAWGASTTPLRAVARMLQVPTGPDGSLRVVGFTGRTVLSATLRGQERTVDLGPLAPGTYQVLRAGHTHGAQTAVLVLP